MTGTARLYGDTEPGHSRDRLKMISIPVLAVSAGEHENHQVDGESETLTACDSGADSSAAAGNAAKAGATVEDNDVDQAKDDYYDEADALNLPESVNVDLPQVGNWHADSADVVTPFLQATSL